MANGTTTMELLEQLQAAVQRMADEAVAREARWEQLTNKWNPNREQERAFDGERGSELQASRARSTQLADSAEQELHQTEAALEEWLKAASRFGAGRH